MRQVWYRSKQISHKVIFNSSIQSKSTNVVPSQVLVHPRKIRDMSVDSLPPNDVISTANVPPVPLSKAQSTPLDISLRNISRADGIVPASIGINDALITSKHVLSAPTKQLYPNKRLVYCVKDQRMTFVPTAEPTPAPPTITEYMPHSPHMWYPKETNPALIPINDPEKLLQKVLSIPSRVLRDIDVSLRSAEPIMA
eukprot:72730_1